MNKFKLRQYVVYKNVVYTVETIWHDPYRYDLQRVFPSQTFEDRPRGIGEKDLDAWDGTTL